MNYLATVQCSKCANCRRCLCENFNSDCFHCFRYQSNHDRLLDEILENCRVTVVVVARGGYKSCPKVEK